MKRLTVVLVAALAMSVAACDDGDDDDDGGGGGGGGDVTPDELEKAIGQVSCEAFGCIFGASPSQNDCAAQTTTSGGLKKAVDEGRLTIDQAKAKACRDAVGAFGPAQCWGASLDETALGQAFTSCDEALKGAVADGADCFEDEECSSGICNESEQVCPGKCQARKADGADCTDDSECQAGLICNTNDKCAVPGGDTSACDDSDDCQEGLSCIEDQCRSPVAANGTCGDHEECATGFCEKTDPNADTGTCKPQKNAGEDCRTPGLSLGFIALPHSPECKGHQVCAGIEFDANGAVTKAGKCGNPSDVNGACFPPDPNLPPFVQTSGCYTDLRCDAGTSKCRALPAAGAACLEGECGSDAFCGANDQCVAKKDIGATCADDEECDSGNCSQATSKCEENPFSGGGDECVDKT